MAKDVDEALLHKAADGRQRRQRVERGSGSGSGCAWVSVERREGLVKVSHHDHLLRVEAPPKQLAVEFVCQLVLGGVGRPVVEAAGHVFECLVGKRGAAASPRGAASRSDHSVIVIVSSFRRHQSTRRRLHPDRPQSNSEARPRTSARRRKRKPPAPCRRCWPGFVCPRHRS